MKINNENLDVFFEFIKENMNTELSKNKAPEYTNLSAKPDKFYEFLSFIQNERKKQNNVQQKVSTNSNKTSMIDLCDFYQTIEEKVPAFIEAKNWKADKLQPMYFSLISKEHDENFLSDNIAALFDINKVGPFAELLYNKIGSRLTKDWPCEAPRKVYREYSLSRWDKNSKHRNRRVDIVIKSEHSCLVLENKTFTDEHDQQTRVYLNHSIYGESDRKSYGIFLTPTGCRASDSRYLNYSYFDLVVDLNSALKDSSSDFKNRKTVELITRELKYNMTIPLKKYLERAQSIRRKNVA